MKLHTDTFGGNLHEASSSINKLDLADYVLAMDVVGRYTIVVFRMPDEMVHRLRKEQGYDDQEQKGEKRICMNSNCKAEFTYIKGVSSTRLQHHCSMPCLREEHEERGDDL